MRSYPLEIQKRWMVNFYSDITVYLAVSFFLIISIVIVFYLLLPDVLMKFSLLPTCEPKSRLKAIIANDQVVVG